MILSCAAMRAVEERAFLEDVTADALMEQVGELMAAHVRRTFPVPGTCVAFCGKGNNAGDAVVTARRLADAGWQVHIVAAFERREWSPLLQAKMAGLEAVSIVGIELLEHVRGTPLIVLDGLLGIGASGELRPPISDCTRAINALRARSHAHVFALDLPTGLDGDRGVADPTCVVADTTLTVGFAKAGLLADGAANFVGRLRVLPLPELSSRAGNLALGGNVLTPESLCALLPRRQTDTHKGDYGRVGIIAGSPGFLGAAALCAAACVRSGAGLVTLYCRGEAARQLAAMVPWEVMVRTVVKLEEVHDFPHDALALGPGLGRESFEESNALIEHLPQPTVVDADGLNGLATNPAILERCAGPRILTPHPGEMARLAPELAGIARAETVRGFLRRYPRTTLLLKGSRTVIGHGDEPLAYNSTGTPGMATGGMGDILTGVIAGLLGQGLSPVHAAQVGTWLCGRAGELATDSGAETEETLTPTRLLDYLAPAFRELRSARHGRL